MDKELLIQRLAELPLFQYEFISPSELTFSERIRTVCRQECPMYGTTWACPPAVGTVEACQAHCLSFPHALMMTSVAEVSDIANLQETLAARGPHEALTHQVEQLLRERRVICQDARRVVIDVQAVGHRLNDDGLVLVC